MASLALGLDPGTFFFHTAEKMEDGKVNIKIIRNCFIELPGNESTEQVLSQNDWQYIKDGNSYFVFGDDSLTVSRIFPDMVLRRPMQDGILNKGEEKKMKVIAKIIETSIGKAPDKDSLCCFCISSESVDSTIDSIFHVNRLEGMIKRLGWNTKVIDEGMGIILSQRPCFTNSQGEESPYSGVGISFGAGKVNCVLAYKGLQILGMSATRSGDWIDKKVAEQTDSTISAIIYAKETKLDFNNIDMEDDIIFALSAYYENMIKYVFTNFANKFKKIKSEFDAPLTIVIGGGTSMPPGFCDKVRSVVSELDLPFEIKEIVHASDPRNAVVKGLLTQAIISQKKLSQNKLDELLE
jgi:hypothetical protein